MKHAYPLFSKVACEPFSFRTVDKLTGHIIEAPDMGKMIESVKRSYAELLAKMTYDDGSIQIEQSEVFIQKEKIFINDISEASPTFTTYLRTYCDKTKRTIKSKVKVHRNPDYDGNPKCEFCDKKVLKRYSSKKNDPERTAVQVCKHCKDVLAIARRVLDKND